MSIFDLVLAQELTAYWQEMTKDRAPYLGETLFPNDKKLGLDLKWLKGSKGLPVVLRLSAFDVKAVPRDRIGFDKVTAEMPFFKESLLIEEALRQDLNKVLATGNQVYIDAVMKRVFADDVALLEGAAAQRERMRMMLLTTGSINISSNGQAYEYDYGLDAAQFKNASVSWSAIATANPIEDIRGWQIDREDATGVKPTRALCDRKTWGYLINNDTIKKSIFVLSNGQATVSDAKMKDYLLSELGLEVVVYSKRFKNESNVATPYVPEDTFVLFPTGDLGTTWFGTTPEESDLMGSAVANVAITDMGVAVTTIKQADPVNVETKVTMICLPSFEAADQIIIADVKL